MDIQITTTPKKHRTPFETPPKESSINNSHEFSTPPKNSHRLQTPPSSNLVYETPSKEESIRKRKPTKKVESHSNRPLKENPESKRHLMSHQKSSSHSDEYEQYQVSMFTLSRLEQDYSLVHMLGSGNFSQVGLYKSRLSGDIFAIKEARANSMSINEVQALGSLWVQCEQSPNVVRYYHSWVEEGKLYLVMQYCEDNLKKIIDNHRLSKKQFDEPFIKKYLKQALLGLHCLHRLNIIHLDVKPENLLINKNILKIADFGLCRAARLKLGEIDEGDSRYLAKQVLNYSKQLDLTKADIYSLGVTIYQMLTLQQMPNNGEKWMNMREEGLRLKNRMDLTNYSESLLDVIERIGHKDWRNRPSAGNLLQQKYFKNSVRLQHIINDNKSTRQRENSL